MGFFQTLGVLTTIFFVYYFGKEVAVRTIKPTDWSEYKGDWAIVTGSSYGLGKSFAIELARRGLNVVLTARTKSKLEEVASEIKSLFPKVQTKIIIQDATDPQWESMKQQIQGLNISVLVNNVGGGNLDGSAKRFHEYSFEYHDSIHNTNFQPAKGWTLLTLPIMFERKRGRILSCSSLGTMFGFKVSLYPAVKAALHSLSYSINNEYINDGIRAEALVIGLCSTPAIGSPEADPLGIVADPDQLVVNSLSQFGYWEVYSPTVGHAFNYWLAWLAPTPLRALIASAGFEDVEKKYYAKGQADIASLHKEGKKSDL